jgi:hypothetical protein
MKILGLDETADPDQKIAALVRSKDNKILALEEKVTELSATGDENKKLLGRIEDLEKRDRARDIEVILARGVDKFRVLPAEKEQLAATFADNVNGLKSLIATRPAGFFGNGKPLGSSADNPDRFKDDQDVSAYAKTVKGPDPLDTESAKVHLQALEILEEKGKDANDPEEYIRAVNEATRILAAA